jgi:hypothetical protein
MNIQTILQVPAVAPDEVSTTTLIIFWVSVAVCVALFIYFLKRTDRIIAEDALAASQKPVAEESRDPQDEEAAAIALAISLYKTQMHDMESLTITLQKVSRIYSPWSSKIYTLRQNPRYK